MQRTAAASLALSALLCCAAHGESCVGDVDLDGRVAAQDLVLLLGDWARPASAGLSTDIDGDGIVGADDLVLLLNAWDTCVKVPAWAEVLEPAPNAAVVTSPSLRAAISATGLAWRVRDRGTGMELVLVPPGTFMMGASVGDALAFSEESPRHAVTISRPYYMGRYEVTQPQFAAVMGYNPSYFSDPTDPPRPVETVAFQPVAVFCARAGFRLPTEAEWEYACRAGTTEPDYAPAGMLLDDIAWYGPNSGYVTHPVGQRACNALGLHDMLGNVWEWCKDWYDPGFYAVSPASDPTGPEAGYLRIIRGGSWYAPESNTRASFRGAIWPEATFGDTGFRVVRNP
jgi:formylglycine-generating enzyme required for sulfatase activity